jgi:hypothetical protein
VSFAEISRPSLGRYKRHDDVGLTFGKRESSREGNKLDDKRRICRRKGAELIGQKVVSETVRRADPHCPQYFVGHGRQLRSNTQQFGFRTLCGCQKRDA